MINKNINTFSIHIIVASDDRVVHNYIKKSSQKCLHYIPMVASHMKGTILSNYS